MLLWKIPYFVFRQQSWPLAMALANAIVSLCTSLKYKIIAAAVFLIAEFLIIQFENKWLLISSAVALSTLVLISYARTFTLVFQPSSIFKLYSALITKSPKAVIASFKDKDFRNLPAASLTEAQALCPF